MSLLNWLRKGQSLVNTDQTSKKDRRGIIAASVEVQNAQCEKNTFQKRRGQYQQWSATDQYNIAKHARLYGKKYHHKLHEMEVVASEQCPSPNVRQIK